MTDRYWLSTPGSKDPPRGPMPLDAIRASWNSGGLHAETTMCKVGEALWLSVAKVFGPPHSVTGVMSSSEFEVRAGETVIGPITLDLLRRGLSAGKVPATAVARRVGFGDWKPVHQIVSDQDLSVFASLTTSQALSASPVGPVVVETLPGFRSSDVAVPPLTHNVLPTSGQPSTSAMVDPCEVYTGGQTIGPVSLEALRQAVADGKVSKVAVGRRLGSSDWKPVAELTGTKFGAAATLAAIRSPWGRLLAAGVGLLGAVVGRYFANLFSSTEPLLEGAAGDYEHTFWRGLRDTGALSQGAFVLLICVQGGFFLAYLVTRVVQHTPASVVADVAWIRDWRRSVKAAAALGPFGVLVLAWLGTLVLVPSPGARTFAQAELQERAGRTEWAKDLYQEVVGSQPDTALGHRAAQKVQEMSDKIKAQDQAEQAKQRSEQAARTKAAKAARDAELAACKSQRWVSYCELNGVPSGGAFRKSTPDECNRAADEFRSIGMKCADCGCSDNEMGVMMRPAH